jgi:hypothetical protein
MLRWVDRLRENVRARDISMLDLHTPVVLREIWTDLQEEHGPLEGSATIYHFGIDEQTGKCRRFAYQSNNDFVSEEGDAPAFGVKPEPEGRRFTDDLSVAGLIEFARRIRTEQDALPRSERVYVGGDLVLTQVRKNVIASERTFRFEDQYDDWQAMCGGAPTGISAVLP